jgi:hypothetical protein
MGFMPSDVSWKVYLALIIPFTIVTVGISLSLARMLPKFSKMEILTKISSLLGEEAS